MFKTLKFIGSLLGIAIVLLLVSAILLVKFVDLNDFKSQISQEVYSYTGKRLQLNGPIHWSFTPWLSVHLSDAAIENDPSFGNQPFASIKQADISIKLLPLLNHIIEIGNIKIDGMEINLITNAQGQHNWQNSKVTSNNSDPHPASSDNEKTPTPTVNHIGLDIAGITVSNSDIHVFNQTNNQNIAISNLQLQSQHISFLNYFPITASFSILSNKPALDADVQLTTQAKLNPLQNNYQLSQLTITSSVRKPSLAINKPTSVDFAANISADLNQETLGLENIVATIGDYHLTGTINGSQILHAATWQGNLQTPKFIWNKLNASNISLQFNSHNNLLNLNPISAAIYQGTYNGDISVNTQTATPKINSNFQLKNIEVGPLFADLANITKIQLSGVGTITGKITTQGNDSNAIINNLTGQGQFALNNGVLQGIDIPFWVNTGKLLLNKQFSNVPTTNSSSTPFGNLTGTFTISHGVLNNNDMLLQATSFRATGQGQADLSKQQLNYVLNTQLVNTRTNKPQGMVIPIKITGPFAHLSIQPEANAVIVNTLKIQYTKNKDKINNAISKFLGTDAGKKVTDQISNLLQ